MLLPIGRSKSGGAPDPGRSSGADPHGRTRKASGHGIGNNSKRTWGGSVSERIWSWFLPALLCFSLLGATWGSLLFRQAEDERERASLELRLTRSAREAVPLLEKALQAGDELRQRILLETLARLTGGRVGIYSKDGKIVLEVDGHEGVDPVSTIAAEDRGARLTETSAQREVLVWESLLRDDQKVAELRLTASLLASESFPWPFWAGLLGIFGLISAATLLLLTRLLDPMRRVVLVLDELGERNPLDLERPEEIARRVPDLGPALSRCVEGMQKRQLRAEESFVEVAIQLARGVRVSRRRRDRPRPADAALCLLAGRAIAARPCGSRPAGSRRALP
jgi:hypothetical protein